MKRILITGRNSFIGTSIEKWLRNYPDRYSVDAISVRDESWKKNDFSKYDVVFHVAGIAHKKETKENADLYYMVNRDLAYEVAQKAKDEKVTQFIFLSSMSVYGVEGGVIDRNTPLNPKSHYGISKLEAEELIEPLGNHSFRVSILRPPMIYGKGCKGNYPKLSNLAIKTPFFPDINNKRSMLYIDNLSEFVRILIDDIASGVFFPQNDEYVCTSELVETIAQAHGKKIRMTKLFNPFLLLLKTSTMTKVFGDLVYRKEMSEGQNKQRHCPIGFKESVRLTEE